MRDFLILNTSRLVQEMPLESGFGRFFDLYITSGIYKLYLIEMKHKFSIGHYINLYPVVTSLLYFIELMHSQKTLVSQNA